jgi:hypothetical protein
MKRRYRGRRGVGSSAREVGSIEIREGRVGMFDCKSVRSFRWLGGRGVAVPG